MNLYLLTKLNFIMKKFVFFLLLLALAATGFAQNAPVNFESGGNGAGWTWTVFENATNPPVEIISNPDPSGINTSATVAKFTALQTGNPWAGCESLHGSANLGPFVLDANNSIIKIMVWKPVISDVGIKLVAPTGWAQPEIKVANTLVNQWEELTFNFSGYVNPPASEGQLDQIVVFPDFDLGGRTQDNIIYFDNITFSSGGGGATEPTVAAPTPTQPAANVISMFSDAYTNVPVDTWRTDWSAATLEDVQIAGNPTKKYSGLDFVGIETVSNQLDITTMTHFHLDVWSADFTFFGVKLVDFGADAAFGGGDDSEHQVNFTTPAQGQWVSLDIPLSSFTGLANRQNIAQFILVGQPSGANTVFVDNVYFYSGTGPTEPAIAAPTPTQPAANVISMFSDAYTNVPVDTWRTDWSAATLEDVQIAGNPTKKYSGLDFVGIETVSSQIDATAMTHFHMDVWSADFTFFGVKLVDFGADAAFGGGDDTEHQLNFTAPAQGEWVSLDMPFADFTGLASRQHLAQLILVGQPTGANTVFVDNVYFYNEAGGGTEPTVAAPTPTHPAANVISMFSDAYTNVPVDTWRTDWSAATLEDVQIAGNPTKKYSGLDFVGIETVSSQIDATEMTHFHMDVWSADFTFFGVKLVDFGADAAFGGGDDSEHQVNFVAPVQGTWVSLDIPLSSFAGLASRQHLAQLILVGQPTGANTVFVDNVYFYNDGGTGPVAPTVAAPTPTRPADYVISMFSDAYTNVPVDTWRTDWSAATLEDVQIAGNPTKKYSGLDFVGIETVANQIDATSMTHFHLDVWSPDFTFFGVKLVDFGADAAFGGGDDTEHQVNFTAPAQGQWVSLDIPFADFTGLASRQHLAQLILVGQPTGGNTVYVDNVYFYDINTGIGNVSQQPQIRVYPNPVQAGGQVYFGAEATQIQIFDLNGKELISVSTPYLNALNLEKGIYIVKIRTISGSTQVTKLVVN
ncbi:T9SS C-terminal target domain-containing protein [Sphingobacteriales bacterium UPWRP_1]|nr:hypothetical protein B6N25_15895 [Sphingobacteriales bacterium TSM_CSS]PSJ74102.1 T9SS C-terminal target domain-containing protein [Sphingobacteriales bacterium UPWRP_1]